MTIEEVKKMKSDIEVKMMLMLSDFQAKTGLEIEKIGIATITHPDGRKIVLRAEVDVKL